MLRQSKRKPVSQLTSNEYYGGLNRRYDNRASLLVRLGFVIKFFPGEKSDVRVWCRIRPRSGGDRQDTIQTSTVLYADNRAWRDTLCHILRRY